MPIPKANPNEKGEKAMKEFISSCMANKTMNKEFPVSAQRYAVCRSQWDRRKKRAKADEEIKWDDSEDFFVI